MKKTIIAVLVGVILSACTNFPHKAQEASSKQSLPDFNYVVIGGDKWGLVQVFEMHQKTYVQFLDLERANPVFLDPAGDEISHTRTGMYAVIDRSLNAFTVVSAYGRAKVYARAIAPLLQEMDSNEDGQSGAGPAGAGPALDRATATVLERALDYSARQLQELQALETQGIDDPGVSKRLDLIEKRLAVLNEAIESGNLPVLHVYFDDNSTAFLPDTELSALLVSTASEANKVLIRGYTDARAMSATARKLANLRAKSAKQFFKEHGIEQAKIKSTFVPAGGHVALNEADGRSFNRRVDILFKFPDSDIKTVAAAAVWSGKTFK